LQIQSIKAPFRYEEKQEFEFEQKRRIRAKGLIAWAVASMITLMAYLEFF